MSFWSSELLRERNESEGLITPFHPEDVKHGAYQLRLGTEYYLTSDDPQHKRTLQVGEQIAIPPGQFALLLTGERVKVPLDSLAFISIRARYKLRGLVNVSGFHVDPGYEGRLKFGVYNAGSSQVVIDSGSPVFSIWFCKFISPTTDEYNGHWKGTDQISAEDIMKLQGRVSSPGQLRTEVDAIKEEINTLRGNFKLVAAVLGSIVALTFVTSLFRLLN
jgi:dCTP deaminase